MNQLLQPAEFFAEVRVGDFIVLTPEGLRYYVVDLAKDEDPFFPGKILVYGACRAGKVSESNPMETVKIRLSRRITWEGTFEDPREVETPLVFAHRCNDLERGVEILRLNPGSWLMRRI